MMDVLAGIELYMKREKEREDPMPAGVVEKVGATAVTHKCHRFQH
jgi:hypothetical protein